jgi:DNA-binding MarR family transcriptional regulator
MTLATVRDNGAMPAAAPLDRDAVLAHFNRNLFRFIIGAAQALNNQLIQRCAAAGHDGLKSAFYPLLSHFDGGSIRNVDIAKHCGITPQAAGQLVNELERLGYLIRRPDASDQRAKRLQLTAKGKQLIADASRLAGAIDAQLGAALGDDTLAELKLSVAQLLQDQSLQDQSRQTREAPAAGQPSPHQFALALRGLANYCERELMELDRHEGHLRLKMSFGQVITHVSPYGSLINDIAKLNGVSKQAISQLVKEIEEIGYIERRQNPQDARSAKIFLTDYGLKLIRDSVANIGILEQRFLTVLSERRFKRFARAIEQLYDYFYASGGTLMDESQRIQAEASLLHFMEELYRQRPAKERALLFSRSGNRIRLSKTALELLAGLETKTD